MSTKMDYKFSMIPRTNIPRSVFNRTHGYKTTFDAGYLVPFYLDEVLPGDTFNCKATLFARLATLVAPVMDNAYLDVFFFYVPNRLIWRHWKEFNGENLLEGSQTKEYLVPQVEYTDNNNELSGTLVDYFGFPTGVSKKLSVSALPFRAYRRIYNDWFRDENFQPSINVTTGEVIHTVNDDVEKDMYGDDRTTVLSKESAKVLLRGKRHDYFTSALPWPQKGPGVEINLGAFANITGSIPVNSDVITSSFVTDGGVRYSNFKSTYSGSNDKQRQLFFEGSGASIPANNALGSLKNNSFNLPVSGLQADLSSASAITINNLRQAFQLQRFYERDARGGTRYTEIVRSHFGVVSPDSRLQRSEYLGGSSTPVNISTVVQNSETSKDSPQGNLSAFGIVGTKGTGFTKSFTEHGIVIGLVNIRTDLSYQQGINRMWSRKTRVEYYWPDFAHLGEQAILNKEIYAQGTEEDNKIFGYQERYAEYRYHPSVITGKLRSTYPQSLDVWHFAQKFDNLPKLNHEFIEDKASYAGVKRAVAVQNEPQFILDSYISLRCARPMPVYSVPGLVSHF